MMLFNLTSKFRSAVVAVSFAVAAAGTSFWLHAQAADVRPVPSLMPPGALLYLEAKDFGSLLNSWNRSAEKRRWLASANYQVISFSRLVRRLGQAQDEFAAVAGMPIGMNLADQVAGARSGFAFYDLSALSFVYITQLPSSRVDATALWRSRTRYKSREVAGIPFYVKSNDDGERSVAFTSYKDWFVISTDEDRMAETLVLLSGAKAASLATESWFTQAVKQSQTQGDLRMVYNLAALIATPQFRTYWLQRNFSELKPFGAGISDLFVTAAGFEEHRSLLRATESPAHSSDASLAEALAYAPSSSALYRAWVMPDTRQLSETFTQVISGERPTGNVFNAPAPEVTPEAGAVGSESDLEIRIDEPPYQRSSQNSITPVVDAVLAMQPTALLHVQLTEVLHDGVFVTPNSAVVVLCRQPDRSALDNAIAQLAVLQTGKLDPLHVSIEGNAIILARLGLARAATRPATPQDVTYMAVYSHHVAWPHYKKLFDVLNTHAASPEMEMSNSTPPFFSGNVQSLGDSLSRLRSASISSRDSGAFVEETLRYQLAQP